MIVKRVSMIVSLAIYTNCILPHGLYAQQGTLTESKGYACMGSELSRKDTEKAALSDAKRKAAEQVITYIHSQTRVNNSQLDRDIIDSYTNGTVKVLETKDSTWYKDKQSGDCYKVTIKAEVIPDPDGINKARHADLGPRSAISTSKSSNYDRLIVDNYWFINQPYNMKYVFFNNDGTFSTSTTNIKKKFRVVDSSYTWKIVDGFMVLKWGGTNCTSEFNLDDTKSGIFYGVHKIRDENLSKDVQMKRTYVE